MAWLNARSKNGSIKNCCLVEHILNILSIIMEAMSRQPQKNPLRVLFEVQVPLIFTFTELNWWKALLSKWFNIVVTFAWTFMDLFVMCISVGLASQFKQINADLQQMKGRVSLRFLMKLQHRSLNVLFLFCFVFNRNYYKAHIRRFLDFASYPISEGSEFNWSHWWRHISDNICDICK